MENIKKGLLQIIHMSKAFNIDDEIKSVSITKIQEK